MSAYGLDPGQVRHGLVREERRLEGTRREPLQQLVKKVGPEKAEQMLQTAEQGFKENYALLKKLSEM